MRRSLIIYISIFCLFSCQEKKPKYYYLLHNNTNTDVIIDGGIKDSLETGAWAFYNQNKDLISKGNYVSGLKKGDWDYQIDSTNASLNWSVFFNDTTMLSINYLSKWVVVNDQEFLFRATFNDADTLKGKYFLLSKISNDSVNIKLNEYSKQFVVTIKKLFAVKSLTRLLLKNDKKEIYYNKVNIIRENKCFVVYEACVEIKGISYDFIFSTDDLTNLSDVIFFNVLEGCFINKTRIINPLYPFTFEKLENE